VAIDVLRAQVLNLEMGAVLEFDEDVLEIVQVVRDGGQTLEIDVHGLLLGLCQAQDAAGFQIDDADIALDAADRPADSRAHNHVVDHRRVRVLDADDDVEDGGVGIEDGLDGLGECDAGGPEELQSKQDCDDNRRRSG